MAAIKITWSYLGHAHIPVLLRPVETSVIFTVYMLRLVHEFVIPIHKVFMRVERPWVILIIVKNWEAVGLSKPINTSWIGITFIM